MLDPKLPHFDTLSLHAGSSPDPTTGARAVPIYQSASFVFSPGFDVLDIPRVAALAHEHGLPLLVDATFITPYLLRPFDDGADLLFHSATKFCAVDL